jgi:hypothetical protein
MAKRGLNILPPGRQASALPSAWRVKEIKIAAAHENETLANQSDGTIAEIVRLPDSPGWKASMTEKHLRDNAISLANKVAVERPEREDKPMTSLWRQAVSRATAGLPVESTPQMSCRLCSAGEILIKWNDNGRSCRGAGVPDHHRRQAPLIIADTPVIAVTRATLERRFYNCNVACGAKEFRCRSQDDNRWIKVRQPDQ